ncbi:MAG: circadian clock KaiB family protein [Anaerolineae bacterium]|nr:circadian clock KaiB family protein [Anaerolineae bacterium]
MDGKIVLHLYVTGGTFPSENARANLKRLCQERLGGCCQIRVIDVLEQSELAETHKIIATPTLLKLSPKPSRRIIGDLSDSDKVIAGLGLCIDKLQADQEEE